MILLQLLPDNVVCIMFALVRVASFGCDHCGYSTILLQRLPFCCLCVVFGLIVACVRCVGKIRDFVVAVASFGGVALDCIVGKFHDFVVAVAILFVLCLG